MNTISFEQWVRDYVPIPNPFTRYENPTEDVFIFEHYGSDTEEHHHIKNFVGTKHIWTAVHCDNDSVYIIPGKHYVNRLGYYITEMPYPEDEKIEVVVDEGYEDITYLDIDVLENLADGMPITDQDEVRKVLHKVVKFLERNI